MKCTGDFKSPAFLIRTDTSLMQTLSYVPYVFRQCLRSEVMPVFFFSTLTGYLRYFKVILEEWLEC